MNAVVDTNILIDYLNGSTKARAELDRFERISISVVTWMEVLVGVEIGGAEDAVRAFLKRFDVQPIEAGIAERAVDIRRKTKIRLPDAIVWATAMQLGVVLMTRNTRDFPSSDPGIRIPYRL
jgi:predicted nucleic acid-binding protein